MRNILFAIVGLLCTCTAFAQTPQYKILNKFKLEGDGGWDYLSVDESTNRLFVSHGSMVQVVDLEKGSLVGTIKGLNGVHGITFAHDLNKAFLSSGRDSSVVVIDLKTLETIGKVKITGSNPDAILYDPFSRNVFTFNGGSANATVIDADSYKIKTTIMLDGKPEFAVADGKGKVYVNNEDKSMVYLINSKSLKVEQKWTIAPGEEPTGLAFDQANKRLFAVTDKLMVILDSDKGDIVATVPIGAHVDGVVFDPEKKRAYTSNGEGTVTVVEEVSPNTFKVVETIPTQKGARTIAINTKTHKIYLPTAEYGASPQATKENPKSRPAIIPGTFTVLEVGYSN